MGETLFFVHFLLFLPGSSFNPRRFFRGFRSLPPLPRTFLSPFGHEPGFILPGEPGRSDSELQNRFFPKKSHTAIFQPFLTGRGTFIPLSLGNSRGAQFAAFCRGTSFLFASWAGGTLQGFLTTRELYDGGTGLGKSCFPFRVKTPFVNTAGQPPLSHNSCTCFCHVFPHGVWSTGFNFSLVGSFLPWPLLFFVVLRPDVFFDANFCFFSSAFRIEGALSPCCLCR